jgi:tetrapyrrole methylase family protein/MazG family protein
MSAKVPQDLKKFESLVEIVAHLRGPEGCPWDKEQTHQSLAQYAVEEVFELVDAIERNHPNHGEDIFNEDLFKEELGDVLFQVILQCQVAKERKAFCIDDVLEILNQKMVRRHPHVFGDVKAENAAEVVKNWEQIKRQEKEKNQKQSVGPFDIPLQLPALQRSFKIGLKTEKARFDWQNSQEVYQKVKEELDELHESLAKETYDRQEEEFGDLLFALAQWARHLKIEPETALRKANQKFESRYAKMLALAQSKGLNFQGLSIAEKESLWCEIKNSK